MINAIAIDSLLDDDEKLSLCHRRNLKAKSLAWV